MKWFKRKVVSNYLKFIWFRKDKESDSGVLINGNEKILSWWSEVRLRWYVGYADWNCELFLQNFIACLSFYLRRPPIFFQSPCFLNCEFISGSLNYSLFTATLSLRRSLHMYKKAESTFCKIDWQTFAYNIHDILTLHCTKTPRLFWCLSALFRDCMYSQKPSALLIAMISISISLS